MLQYQRKKEYIWVGTKCEICLNSGPGGPNGPGGPGSPVEPDGSGGPDGHGDPVGSDGQDVSHGHSGTVALLALLAHVSTSVNFSFSCPLCPF